MTFPRLDPNAPAVRSQLADVMARYHEATGSRVDTVVIGGQAWRFDSAGRWVYRRRPRPWKRHHGRYPGRR